MVIECFFLYLSFQLKAALLQLEQHTLVFLNNILQSLNFQQKHSHLRVSSRAHPQDCMSSIFLSIAGVIMLHMPLLAGTFGVSEFRLVCLRPKEGVVCVTEFI